MNEGVSPSTPRDALKGRHLHLSNRQFHTGDVNQCLPLITHLRVGANGCTVPNVNFSEFMFLLVYYGIVLSFSARRINSMNNVCFVLDSSF